MSMHGEHHYQLQITWTGNNGTGTSDAKAYERSHTLSAAGKEDLQCSSDPAFRGDSSKYNPEEFLVAAISSCHMLWYLHLCADAGVIVTDYVDKPEGVMVDSFEGKGGRFTGVILKPTITITDGSKEALAIALHERAREKCFIANSCNFPIHHQPIFVVKS